MATDSELKYVSGTENSELEEFTGLKGFGHTFSI